MVGKKKTEKTKIEKKTEKKKRPAQSHGLNSKVYAPILLYIFNARWRQGASTVIFSLDDVRNAQEVLHVEARNAADVIYRMKSRTKLPLEILEKGFFILRSVGRGQYQFEKGTSTIFEPADDTPVDALDLTPLPVRRLLPELLADMDEQAILTIAGYCKILDHFTGLTVYRLRNHVRKGVPGVGQAELDAIDVGVALSNEEEPTVFPIEAKPCADALNRAQISNMIAYCNANFRGMTVRPLAVKVDDDSIIHVMEFNNATKAADLRVVKSIAYSVKTSPEQIEWIRSTKVKVQ